MSDITRTSSRCVLESTFPARAPQEPGQTVYIRADRGLPYGDVMQTMGAVAAAGFSRISLLAEQAPNPAAR
ncbi:MAG: ExbD/TolR family protein [Acetobacteraceae bacterium]